VAHARGALEASTTRWIEVALAGSDVADRDGVVAVLEAVLFATMVSLVTGGIAPGDVGSALDRAVRTVLRPQ
jgi:hypothetical protein